MYSDLECGGRQPNDRRTNHLRWLGGEIYIHVDDLSEHFPPGPHFLNVGHVDIGVMLHRFNIFLHCIWCEGDV